MPMGEKLWRQKLLEKVTELAIDPRRSSSTAFLIDARKAKKYTDLLIESILSKLDGDEKEELEEEVNKAEQVFNEKMDEAVQETKNASRMMDRSKTLNEGEGKACIKYCQKVRKKLLELLMAKNLLPE